MPPAQWNRSWAKSRSAWRICGSGDDHIRPEEITAISEQRAQLSAAIGAARLRLDALRLIGRCRSSADLRKPSNVNAEGKSSRRRASRAFGG
jgi:hypothetical protein